MEKFQTWILGLSITAFVIALIVLLISFRVHKVASWPPTPGKCPDNWTYSGGICTNPYSDGVITNCKSFNVADEDKGSMKQKCAYAKDCNAGWDAVTYGGNPCP